MSTIEQQNALLRHVSRQMAEVLDALNLWGTGMEFEVSDPSHFQLWQHYIHVGRAQMMLEVHSALNVHGAREEFGIAEPTEEQLWRHYENCGRLQIVAEVYSPLNVWGTGIRLGCDPRFLPTGDFETAVWDTYCLYCSNIPRPKPSRL